MMKNSKVLIIKIKFLKKFFQKNDFFVNFNLGIMPRMFDKIF